MRGSATTHHPHPAAAAERVRGAADPLVTMSDGEYEGAPPHLDGDELDEEEKKKAWKRGARRAKAESTIRTSHVSHRFDKQRRALTKPADERTEEDFESLDEILGDVKFASSLPYAKRLEVCKAMLYEKVPKSTMLFKEGDVGEEFYIILSGSTTVSTYDSETQQNTDIATLYAGDSFGELALLSDTNYRQASVTTREACEFVKLTKIDFDSILKTYSVKELGEKISYLQMIPMFENLDRPALQSLAYVLTIREFDRKKVIARQGEEMDEMYFIVSGTCKVVREVPNFFKSKRKMRLKFDISNYNQHLGAGAFLRLEELTKVSTLQNAHLKKDRTARKNADSMFKNNEKRPVWSGESRNTTLSMTKVERTLPTLFLETGTLSQYDHFADLAVIQRAKQHETIITLSRCTCYVLNKWDLLRRVDKRTMQALLENCKRNIPSDEMLRREYLKAKQWDQYKSELVADIIKEKAHTKALFSGRT